MNRLLRKPLFFGDPAAHLAHCPFRELVVLQSLVLRGLDNTRDGTREGEGRSWILALSGVRTASNYRIAHEPAGAIGTFGIKNSPSEVDRPLRHDSEVTKPLS